LEIDVISPPIPLCLFQFSYMRYPRRILAEELRFYVRKQPPICGGELPRSWRKSGDGGVNSAEAMDKTGIGLNSGDTN